MPTEVLVDNQPFQWNGEATDTLGEVVEAAKSDVNSSGRVIVGVFVDGTDVTGPDLEKSLAAPLAGFGRVELHSGQPAALVVEAIRDALDLLGQTNERRERAIDALTQGNVPAANEALGACFRDWAQIHLAIAQSLAFLQLDPAGLEVNGQPLDQALEAITDQLKRVREALQAQDTVLLSDTLEYEFGESTQLWQATLEVIGAAAAQRTGSTTS